MAYSFDRRRELWPLGVASNVELHIRCDRHHSCLAGQVLSGLVTQLFQIERSGSKFALNIPQIFGKLE